MQLIENQMLLENENKWRSKNPADVLKGMTPCTEIIALPNMTGKITGTMVWLFAANLEYRLGMPSQLCSLITNLSTIIALSLGKALVYAKSPFPERSRSRRRRPTYDDEGTYEPSSTVTYRGVDRITAKQKLFVNAYTNPPDVDQDIEIFNDLMDDLKVAGGSSVMNRMSDHGFNLDVDTSADASDIYADMREAIEQPMFELINSEYSDAADRLKYERAVKDY